jgi:hypothetical protein
LGRRLVPDFLAMMLNDASRGSSYDGVPACNVTDHAADGRAFQTAFCGSDAWKQCKGRGKYKSDNTLAHFSVSYELRYPQKPRGPTKVAAMAYSFTG